ncbi:hypothetical protein BU24DRAFT_179848 [Aaosphaeria arxii CBS 175.79]|uniref:Uncharacterized protein n=1 Tax=Aaosphaeria arxii CBS 175.79 TaxID=1450172 RepID=A0A6A5XRG2_9PLEO|nr:uncharacterized protein BU24DRAFT_179848 [Aaosphaeria arxii CBS 175.79]KAF2015523.1 hypothetical protein BU24DRAFT_179848 [Aaosphaeria arxii CBS 175.79]
MGRQSNDGVIEPLLVHHYHHEKEGHKTARNPKSYQIRTLDQIRSLSFDGLCPTYVS